MFHIDTDSQLQHCAVINVSYFYWHKKFLYLIVLTVVLSTATKPLKLVKPSFKYVHQKLLALEDYPLEMEFLLWREYLQMLG